LVALSLSLVFGDQPPIPSAEERVRGSEAIFFISVTNVTTNSYTNTTGQKVTVLAADAVVERTLKGTPQKCVKLRQEIIGDNSTLTKLADGRFLALTKRSGDSYVPSGFYGLGPVIGSGVDTDRVVWPMCNSVAEAVDAIEKELKK
jgi:hypothetical protein